MIWDENPDTKPKKQSNSPWENGHEEEVNASKKNHKQINNDFFANFTENFSKFNGQFPKQPDLKDKKFFIKILLGVLILWLSSGIYQIQEGEEAVVLRFGKYVRTSTTGLNYHLPSPIEAIIKEKTGLIRRENSADIRKTPRSSKYAELNGRTSVNTIDNLVLTGDENILDIDYVVQWKISNLRDFIFNLQDTRDTVINVCESALREAVGNSTLARAYTDGRSELEFEVKNIAQETLESYKAGVEITSFQLMKVDPPAEVIESFREVQNAKADKEREINLAKAHERAVLPEARGVSAKIINQAKAYKQEVIERSSGEAKRFIEIYQEYKKAPDVTRKRIYLDTINKILSGTEKVFINGKNNNGVVPYLALPELKK